MSNSPDQHSSSSLMSSATHRWFRRISLFIYELAKKWMIFTHQNLISNWLTYLVHAKSTGDFLISFGFSNRLDRSLVSAKRSANRSDQKKKKRLHFLAYLWSQSEFMTQRNAERKTNPKSEMTKCSCVALLPYLWYRILFAYWCDHVTVTMMSSRCHGFTVAVLGERREVICC